MPRHFDNPRSNSWAQTHRAPPHHSRGRVTSRQRQEEAFRQLIINLWSQAIASNQTLQVICYDSYEDWAPRTALDRYNRLRDQLAAAERPDGPAPSTTRIYDLVTIDRYGNISDISTVGLPRCEPFHSPWERVNPVRQPRRPRETSTVDGWQSVFSTVVEHVNETPPEDHQWDDEDSLDEYVAMASLMGM